MSQRNVDVVRAAFAAWSASDIDALRELYHVDAVTRGLDEWPEPGPNVGRDAVLRQYERMLEAWDASSVEILGEPVEAGERVAVRARWRAAGRGPELNMEVTAVFTIRDGRIHAVVFFWDHAEALAAMRPA